MQAEVKQQGDLDLAFHPPDSFTTEQIKHEEVHRKKKKKKDKNKDKDVKLQGDDTASEKRKKQKKEKKMKEGDPTEKDLCEAILIIKKKLPNRSLERVIMRLFETVDAQHKRDHGDAPPQDLANSNIGKKNKRQKEWVEEEQVVSIKATAKKGNLQDVMSQIDMNDKQEQSRVEKLVLPGKKSSIYHDKAGQIASLSHQYYDANTIGLNQLEALKKNMQKMPVYCKPRADNVIIPEEQIEESGLTHNKKINRIFHFNQSETLRTKFFAQSQETSYKTRRQILQLYLKRGLGTTKRIDEDLPPLPVSLNHYKLQLACIFTHAYRKLQSFIFSECQKTIKYLNQEQMKRIVPLLLLCQINLRAPQNETLMKFMRICFGLGDVTISEEQAIQLYVGIQRHLFGKNTTMQNLQNMGKVNNRRDLQAAMKVLTLRAERQKFKHLPGHPINKSQASRHDEHHEDPYAAERAAKPQQIQISNIEREFINEYLQSQNLQTIKKAINMKPNSHKLNDSQIQFIFKQVFNKALTKITQDAKERSQGPTLNPITIDMKKHLISSSKLLGLRLQIISYLYSADASELNEIIDELNLYRKNCNSGVIKLESKSDNVNQIDSSCLAGELEDIDFDQMDFE